MDAVLAKMMNSTVGTPNFKPLDELILIDGKHFVASDNVFSKIDINYTLPETKHGESTESSIVDVCTIKPIVAGSMRMVANVGIIANFSADNYVRYGYIYVYVNGALKHTFFASDNGANSYPNSPYNVSPTGDIFFNANDIITFKFQMKINKLMSTTSATYSGILYDIALKADVTDNLIQVL